jgi:hypothetical protein
MSFAEDRFSEPPPSEPEYCRDCRSTNCKYDTDYGFWECKDCGACWGYDNDDPDYDEVDDPTLFGLEAARLRSFLQDCLDSSH